MLKAEENVFGEKDGPDWEASAACTARPQGPQLAGQATMPKCSFDCERRMFHVGEISLLYRAAGL